MRFFYILQRMGSLFVFVCGAVAVFWGDCPKRGAFNAVPKIFSRSPERLGFTQFILQ
jgi:hypothetical protein